ncbi:hypothetical protein HMPREF0495_00024 [Levilactobacillus brevis ATCC 14869 = DSM 20054]|uniref:Uncharacterized protein n=1 Tax=Levilactobacillus brevis ATCC 14869 = DSM 20054 TaxID=649758 RepID=U2P6W1_LEVBR|nr:hypothetical protein HMPREF0495_00024 [Levilactobacillus brevis ATCC 14869 = DSM 20054]
MTCLFFVTIFNFLKEKGYNTGFKHPQLPNTISYLADVFLLRLVY